MVEVVGLCVFAKCRHTGFVLNFVYDSYAENIMIKTGVKHFNYTLTIE